MSCREFPECVVLEKATLRVIRRRATTEASCLDEALVRRLGKLGRKAERLFGSPQDIEWAVADGEIFLLQARPVTATHEAGTCSRSMNRSAEHRSAGSLANGPCRAMLGAPRADSWEDRQVWSNLNTGEVAPDVMTPATWAMIRFFLSRIAGSVFQLVGADMSRAPIIGLVAGRIYFNANTGLAAMKP